MFTPIKSTKVYEQVVQQIKQMIIDGTLKKGDKLPTERELSEQLQVSRASIREAIKSLEVIGLLEARQGAGNYIKENFDQVLFEPISMIFMLESRNPNEIVELREGLELEAAALAAKNIDKAELEEIRLLVDKIKNSEDEEITAAYDKSFHYAIAKASKNVLIMSVLNVISSLIDEVIIDSRKKILSVQDNKEKLNNQHEMIYISLKDGNESEAYEAMKGHFKLIKDYYCI
ncbi:FadR/GntR family transcriptional regulator [Candidatus Clostridium radicumherbarum]|uniref:FadR/GntR family transcriptional regulator n=1 Tax=Candidatus Clostridium radicumherbarum TaxID=3381662 RepID=A0ABW8TNR7_9CLOT